MKLLMYTFLLATSVFSSSAFAQSETVSGLYYAVLYHDEGNYYQTAKMTLKTVNTDGVMKISANVRVFFGAAEATEFLTYDYDNVPLNLITRQVSIENAANEISMIGSLKDSKLAGDWYSTMVGKVGRFEAQKGSYPQVADGKIHVEPLSGQYKGLLKNTNVNSNLPERVTMSFVTTQVTENGTPKLHVTGNLRFYLGEFGSAEFVETTFSEVQYNPYNRFVSAKTEGYGITLKGTVEHDGSFKSVVFSNGLGQVGEINAKKE